MESQIIEIDGKKWKLTEVIPELPMSIKMLPRFKPHYYMNMSGYLAFSPKLSDCFLDFETKAEAKQVKAFIQLKKLCKAYNGGEIGGFEYSISLALPEKNIHVIGSWGCYEFSFKTEQLATKFIKTFRDLLNDYYMITIAESE